MPPDNVAVKFDSLDVLSPVISACLVIAIGQECQTGLQSGKKPSDQLVEEASDIVIGRWLALNKRIRTALIKAQPQMPPSTPGYPPSR